MSDPRIVFETADGVAHVRFDNPQAFNALTKQMWLDLRDHARAIAADPAIRVAVFRGTGGKARRQDFEHLRGARYIPGTSIGKPAADRPVGSAAAEVVDEAGKNGLGFAGQTVPSGGSDPSNRYRTT